MPKFFIFILWRSVAFSSSLRVVWQLPDIAAVNNKVKAAMKIFLGQVFSPTMYLLLAVLQIMQYCCKADAGSINIAPVTQHANLSDYNYALFYCRATGSNTRWNIQNRIYVSGNRTVDGYRLSEVEVQHHENGSIVHDMYLEIQTSLENNETNVQCIVFVDTPTYSPSVQLIVQGGPAAPVVTLRLVNSELIILQWNVPFTWPYTSIQHYSISSNNSMQNWDRLEYHKTTFSLYASEPLSECTLYSFTVTANNGLADGEPTTITGGFPVAPRMPDDPIMAHVTFTPDLSPIILLTVKLPEVCGYQHIRYHVTLRNSNSEIIVEEGPIERLYSEASSLQVLVRDNEKLSIAQYVVAEATFSIIGMEEQLSNLSTSKVISVKLNPTSHNTSPMIVTAVSDVPGVKEEGLGTEQGSEILDTDQVVLIAAVGGALLLILVAFSIVIVAVCFHRKRKSAVFRTGSAQKPPMVTNPIYEGQSMYETIDPRFRPISLTSSVSDYPPTPTTSCPPVVESPYAHTQVDPAYAYPPPHPRAQLEDGYTVMASAGDGLGKDTADLGESNLDSEVARYVPDPSMQISEC